MHVSVRRSSDVYKRDPSRRRFLQSISAGVMGYSLAEMLALQGVGETTSVRRSPAKQVLVVYEEGGISQMDTWDPKPDAAVNHRTPYTPIATSVPGIHFSSLMPSLAQHADKLSVIRSMTTAQAPSHPNACKEFFKGYRFDSPAEFPDIGSVVTEILGTASPQLPGYVFCPGINMPNHVSSTGFLPAARAPWKLGTKNLGENLADPDWQVRSLKIQSELSGRRFSQRRSLRNQLAESRLAENGSALALNEYYEIALDLLTSPDVQNCLDLGTETDATRDLYGRDHRGCCYLLGRKLIEAGVRFVTVTVIQPPEHVGRPGYGRPNGVFLNWDHHEGIYKNGPCGGPQGSRNQERYGLPHPIMMPSPALRAPTS